VSISADSSPVSWLPDLLLKPDERLIDIGEPLPKPDIADFEPQKVEQKVRLVSGTGWER
jgi:hypothetical protein